MQIVGWVYCKRIELQGIDKHLIINLDETPLPLSPSGSLKRSFAHAGPFIQSNFKLNLNFP